MAALEWGGQRSRGWCPTKAPAPPRSKGGRFQKGAANPTQNAPSEAPGPSNAGPGPSAASAPSGGTGTSRSAIERVQKENASLRRQFNELLKSSKEREASLALASEATLQGVRERLALKITENRSIRRKY